MDYTTNNHGSFRIICVQLIAIVAAALFAVQTSNAQNLITNNGFESYSTLPTGPGQWSKATSWSNVNGWIPFQWPYASPDYCHASGSGNVKLPNTVFGTTNAYAGGGVMGFITYYPSTSNFREYLAQQLSSPMIVGNTYTISFFITNGVAGSIGGMGIANFGVYLSVGMPPQVDHEPIVSATPQWTSGSILYSTSWQQVSFTVVPTAAWDHITYGNFRTDASTTSQTFVSVSSPGAYYFLDETVVEPATVLPVELVNFEATAVDNYRVDLMWETVTEINNDYFTVEKSLDGVNWETVLIEQGAGNSANTLEYSGVDRDPYIGVSYYRLKQTDFDGKTAYAPVKSVFISEHGEANVTVFPNPTAGQFTIEADSEELRYIRILNELGQDVTDRAAIQFSEGKAEVDISHMSSGIYIVKTTSSVHKISKQ